MLRGTSQLKHRHLLPHPNGPTRKLEKNVRVQVHRRTTNCPPTAFFSTTLAMQQWPWRMFILWLIQVLSCHKDICQVVARFSILRPLQRDWIRCSKGSFFTSVERKEISDKRTNSFLIRVHTSCIAQNCCCTFLHGNNDFKKYLTQDAESVSRVITTQIYTIISEEKNDSAILQ